MENKIKKYLYVDRDTKEMYVIPENLIGKYNYKELTGGNAIDKDEFEHGINKMSKEPDAEFITKGSFDFNSLQKFFKVVKTIGADYITIYMQEDDKPIKIIAKNSDGEEIAYWLAPRIGDD